MEVETFKTSNHSISKVKLDDDEWLKFLKRVAASGPSNIDTTQKITTGDIDWIDTNRCVPICNGSMVSSKGIASVVNGEIGEVFLRLWFGSNGINTTLNRGMEIFPNRELKDVVQEFDQWWKRFPPEPQIVGNILVSKPINEFGIGHLQAWVKNHMYGDSKEPKKARERYLHNIKPWAYAYDLMHLFVGNGYVRHNDGKMTVSAFHNKNGASVKNN
jgi:hypothetical protein